MRACALDACFVPVLRSHKYVDMKYRTSKTVLDRAEKGREDKRAKLNGKRASDERMFFDTEYCTSKMEV